MQQVTSRPWIAAGVAAVGASMVAATPIQPVSLPAVEIPDIQLTAGELSVFDPLGSLAGIFDTASANATEVAGVFFEAPGAALQQTVVNQVNNLGAIISDPGSIGDVLEATGANAKDVFGALTFLVGDQKDFLNPLAGQTLDTFHNLIYQMLNGTSLLGPIFGVDPLPDSMLPLLNLAASPLSGVAMGFAGPIVSPVVPFLNPLIGVLNDAIVGETVDPAALVSGMADAPFEAINGFFNGATLDLDPAAVLLGETGILPDGFSIDGLSLAFGGLLTPGDTTGGIGGSLLNSLGIDTILDIEGKGIGPIGALTNLSQMIAGTLGWDGVGNPLTDLTFPTLDFGDMLGGAFGDFNLADMLPTDLLDNLGGLGDAFGFLMGIPEMLLGMLTSAF